MATIVTKTEYSILDPNPDSTGQFGLFKAGNAPGRVLVLVTPQAQFNPVNAIGVDQDGLQKVIDAAVRVHREVYGAEPTIPAA